MKSYNFRIIKGLSIILIFCLALIACSGSSGSTSVVPAGSQTSISLSAASTSIAYNASTTVNWSSTSSTSCTFSGGGTGTTGSYNTGALTTTTTYTLTCGSEIQNLIITVAPPTITAFAAATPGNVTITSTNDLSNGTIITISGTTNYNGTYTVSNRTTTSFTIAHAFITNEAKGTWQLSGGMMSDCSTAVTTGNLGAINLASYTPSRFTGVAPLSVFFDATGTTATATAAPFHDLEYRWNFGENVTTLAGLPGGANWTNGSTNGSRNLATGPVAAHVYETPGVYIVALTATDGTNSVSNSCAQIVVQDPNTVFSGTNTVCVAATSLPVAGSGGCPAGANTVQQADFATAIKTYLASGKRILFKRGDTFSESTGAGIAVTGPGIIGAYGTGAKPVIRSTGNVPLLTLSGSSTPTIKDWRVMDIYFDGLAGSNAEGFKENGGFDQFTLLRIDLRNVSYGFHTSGSLGQYWNSSGFPGHRIHSEYAIVDSTLIGMTTGSYAAFANGHYFALMGNFLWDGTTTRFPQLVKAVISNNTLRNTTNTKEVIKLHAPTACNSTEPANSRYSAGCNYLTDTFPMADAMENDGIKTFGYSQYIEIADNKMIQAAASSSPWIMTAGPQNGNSDERVLDLVFERNWIVTGTSANAAIAIFMRNATLRNNICDMSVASKYPTCFLVASWGIEPPSDKVRIYNNSAYSSYTVSESYLADIRAIATNVTLQNNLAYMPSATTAKLRSSSTPGSGFIESNNSSNTQVKSTSPKFVSPSTGPDGFKIAADSYAVGTGVVVPVWSDFFSVPQTSTRDLGAVIH